MVALEGLQFDNTVLRVTDVDSSPPKQPRPVRNAIYAYVDPTPIGQPKLVAVCQDALELLGLDPSEVGRDEVTEVLAGNRVLPGMQPAAHCYAGYQFGYFSGQLGDGAAIYLGEVVHPVTGVRNELQLKGSGLTPFSRSADGRKVLRSSMREFLASEAMHALGIPTTRAGSLVVSGSDGVIRDIHYSGNPQREPCAVVSRIAPSFIRFGSFEICKSTDPTTGRAGPSAGLAGQLLLPLLGYTIRQHYPHIWQQYSSSDDIHMADMSHNQVLDMVESWFIELCARTARLVAGWQSVGFVHGVLNTDNMSILGLTLDYGPYGFMDRFDSQHVSNGSDDGGRYTYEAQPAICRWNLERLAEALEKTPLPGGSSSSSSGGGSVLPASRARKGLAEYEREFERSYLSIFRRKLGLLGAAGAAAAAAAQGASSSSSAALPTDHPVFPLSSRAAPAVAAAAAAVAAAPADPISDLEDETLIRDLLLLMDQTGADFTNTFRYLADVPLPTANGSSNDDAAAAATAAGSSADDDLAAAARRSSSSGARMSTWGSCDDGADNVITSVTDPAQQQTGNGAAAAAADPPTPSPAAAAAGSDGFGDVLSRIVSSLATPTEMSASAKPTMPMENLQMLLMLAGRDPAVLHTLGLTPASLQQQLAAHTAAAKWRDMTAADKQQQDQQQWRDWLGRYSNRLKQEVEQGVNPELRHAVMNATNPRVVLRNWIAQVAITSAENGQYNKVKQVVDLLLDPFTNAESLELELPAPVAAAAAGTGREATAPAAAAAPAGSASKGVAAAADGVCPLVKVQFDGKPPAWAAKLCVTCSS